jgi:transcriptional regulator with XRE-family HTH domain
VNRIKIVLESNTSYDITIIYHEKTILSIPFSNIPRVIYLEKYEIIIYNSVEVKAMEKLTNDDWGLGAAISQEFAMYLQLGITPKDRTVMIGKQLVLLRTNAHMTQRDVCEILKMSPQTYSGYESGRHEPTVETLIKLSYLYNVSMDDICCKEYFDDQRSEDEIDGEMLGNSNVLEIREAMDRFRAETEAKMQKMQKQIEQLNNK